jgi:hypothetical protein
MVWIYRETVEWAVIELDVMADEDRYALLNSTYAIDTTGRINSQPRFVSSLSMLRFLVRLAERAVPESAIMFDDNRWNLLKTTVEIRNRITHPKTDADVIVEGADVDRAFVAFDWICEQTIHSMDTLTGAVKDHSADLWYVLQKLQEGDPFYTAEYQRIKKSFET